MTAALLPQLPRALRDTGMVEMINGGVISASRSALRAGVGPECIPVAAVADTRDRGKRVAVGCGICLSLVRHASQRSYRYGSNHVAKAENSSRRPNPFACGHGRRKGDPLRGIPGNCLGWHAEPAFSCQPYRRPAVRKMARDRLKAIICVGDLECGPDSRFWIPCSGRRPCSSTGFCARTVEPSSCVAAGTDGRRTCHAEY